ncbi:C40 family peptidase [Janibacter sp. GXQ6167]|uniref:C40 family peptidase n=1 Tax=Janibacter sp. GXQ6167 TaxID=3240791 RepID=UPI0035263292
MRYALKPTSFLAAVALTTSGFVAAQAVTPPEAEAAVVKTSSTRANKAAKLAKTRVNKTPYRRGGTSLTRGADCSGFVQAVYKKQRVKLPRTATQQRRATKRISRGKVRAGDLVFFGSRNNPYHVGIYVGKGQIVDSPGSGRKVKKRKIWTNQVTYGTLRR